MKALKIRFEQTTESEWEQEALTHNSMQCNVIESNWTHRVYAREYSMRYGADVLCFCLLPSHVHGCLPFNSSTYLFENEEPKNKTKRSTHTHSSTTFESIHMKTLKRQRGKYMIPNRRTVFHFVFSHRIRCDLIGAAACVVNEFSFATSVFLSLSKSHSNRLQHMPSAYVYTKPIQFQFYRLDAYACYCAIYTYIFILDSETITNRI